MKTKLLILICISLCSLAYGQDKDLQVISSASKCFEAGNVSLDWTLGEVVVDYYDGTPFGISQGFHQPGYQLVAVKSIPAELGLISVFPNPFSDEFNVKMTFANSEKGDMALVDLKGTTIWKKSFAGKEVIENYVATALPPGSYMLVVSLTDDAFVQSYQLVKTQ